MVLLNTGDQEQQLNADIKISLKGKIGTEIVDIEISLRKEILDTALNHEHKGELASLNEENESLESEMAKVMSSLTDAEN